MSFRRLRFPPAFAPALWDICNAGVFDCFSRFNLDRLLGKTLGQSLLSGLFGKPLKSDQSFFAGAFESVISNIADKSGF